MEISNCFKCIEFCKDLLLNLMIENIFFNVFEKKNFDIISLK